MRLTLLFASAVLLAPSAAFCIGAQEPAPASAEMQKNFAEAATKARLESDGTPPFRVEASFNTFNYQGKPDGSGTMIEDWLRPGVWRRVVTFGGLSWTQVARDGVMRSSGDDPLDASFVERKIVDALLDPVPAETTLRTAVLTYAPRVVGSIPLDCITVAGPAVATARNNVEQSQSTYCVSDKPRLLRAVHEKFGFDIVYNHFVTVGQHVAAQDVGILQWGVTRATLHITAIKAAPTLKDSDFVVPVGPETRLNSSLIDSEKSSDHVLSKVSPRYPEDARQAHISGTVVLSTVVDKTGDVRRVEVMAGPLLLRDESLAAVRQWKYKPFLRDGEPTEVEVITLVNFSFSK